MEIKVDITWEEWYNLYLNIPDTSWVRIAYFRIIFNIPGHISFTEWFVGTTSINRWKAYNELIRMSNVIKWR